MLRAGPFSDERIIRLANRRFVPFFFDLSDRGFAGDPAAKKFVVARRKRLQGGGVPTPSLLFMTPAGELLADVSNYAPAAEVLAKMLAVLREHPEFNKHTAEERGLVDPLARAALRIDLQDYAGAGKELAGVDGDQASYLRGRLARRRRDWKDMEKNFRRVQQPQLADDIRMERTYKLWFQRKFSALEKELENFPKSSNRYTEARYYLGLACYHQDDKKQATSIWRKTILGSPQDRWIYRADWAYVNTTQKGRRTSFSSADRRGSCLGRIGYMGSRNPDLTGPVVAGERKRL